MDKSQIRRLALDFSQGEISRDDYVRRRGLLIEGITTGDVRIERERPRPTETLADTTQFQVPPDFPDESGAAPRRTIWYVAAGLTAVLVAVLGFFYLNRGEAPDPAPTPTATRPAAGKSATTPAVGVHRPGLDAPARTMVESFVAVRDWSAASVAQFKAKWASLSDAQRNEARDAGWFRPLTKAMRDELKTQKALLEFDKNGKAREAGHRIIGLGDYLGVSGQLPAFNAPADLTTRAGAAGATAPSEAPAAKTTTAQVQSSATPTSTDQGTAAAGPTAAVIVAAPGAAGQSSAAAAPLETESKPSRQNQPGAAWLAGADANQFTLQLFAVNSLDKVAALKRNYPNLPVHIVDFAGQTPRYRVLYGEYATEAQARAAHEQLPASLRGTPPKAYVKRLGGLGASTPVRQAASAPPSVQGYTVQVFASSNKANVDRLVRNHPKLGFRVLETASDAPRYRVLYGQFRTAALAQSAAASLPQAVVKQTGQPIVKSVASLAP